MSINRLPSIGIGVRRGMLIFIAIIGMYSFATAQTERKQILIKPLENKVFIKEQGQFSRIARELKTPLPEPVLYGVENGEFNAYFTKNGIIFQFPERRNIEEKDRKKKEGETEEKTVETTWHTSQMLWLNANASVELISEQKVSEYYNYGGLINESTINFVPAYKKLRYVNLYPGVDAEFELSEEGGIKYKFIIQPNVIVPEIAFKWEGINTINTDEKGDLHIRSKFDPLSLNPEWQLIDHSPNAFTSSSHINIPVKYGVAGNIVQFQFSSPTVSSPEGIVIDPWVTNPNYPGLNRAYDIQEDSIGNVFVHGNYSQSSSSNSYYVQKYNPLGALVWTYQTYSQFLGDIAVDNPGNVYIIGGYPVGKRQKLDSTGVQQWVFAGLCEEWRLAFNYSKTTLAICGYFVNPGNNNLAKLDMATGAISDQIAYSEETRSISTDCNGDMYSLHLPSSNLRKTNANFTTGGLAPSGLTLIYSGIGYAYNPDYSSSIFQGFNGNVIQGPYVYIYDGTKLRRFNKTTLSPINDVIVPNAVNYQCSGLAADACGNIYAGTTNSIVKYDSALTYISTIPTTGAVYDILFSSYGNILACGEGFIGSFITNCTAPLPLSTTATSINATCKGGSASIVAAGGIVPYTYSWQPGGQTTATISNLTAGTYTYTVMDLFCHSFSDTITVHQTPQLDLVPGAVGVISPGVISNESCPNSLDGSITVSVSGGTGSYSFSWNTNPIQNTQTAMGLSAGIYMATVMDADSCMDTVSIIISRKPAPKAIFGSIKECNGTATQFTDSSTTASGTISTWVWDFGIGGPPGNYTQNPAPLYANAGNYTTTLIVENSFGCTDTVSNPVQVYYNPVAGFTYSDICLGDTMHFTNTSSIDSSTSIASYLWSFGDNSPTSSLKNPNHYYSVAGTYSVLLVVTTIDSCTDMKTLSVSAFDAPLSAFTFSTPCLYDSAKYTNTSLNPTMGNTAAWSWSFGDGSPLNNTDWSPNHLYSVPGNYQLTLITYSSNLNCSDTLHSTITVFPMPIANFGFSNVCLNQTMIFNDLSNVSSGSITSWSWNFGDGSALSSIQNQGHTYTFPGSYLVTLVANTANSCKDTISKSVVVYPLPVAQFSTSNVCDGSIASFTDYSTIISTDTIQSWSWNFGDGSPVFNNPNATHLFAGNGSYPVQLLVISNFGCRDSISKIIIVNPNPDVSFTANDTIGCELLCINFQNLSSIASGTNAALQWNFGDNSSIGNSQSPNHCYINDSIFLPNYFIINLTVTSDSGCISSLSKNNYITVYPNPNASFTVQPQTAFITDPVISITDLSTGTNFWNWNFGDLTTSAINTPIPHTYADTGAYIITLLATTQYGCTDSAYQTIIIDPDFLFYIPNSFTPDGDGINDNFNGMGIFISSYEMSIFDRWGNLIFFTDDVNKPWCGTANHGNELAQADVYIYSIHVIDFKRRKHNYKGIVTLLK